MTNSSQNQPKCLICQGDQFDWGNLMAHGLQFHSEKETWVEKTSLLDTQLEPEYVFPVEIYNSLQEQTSNKKVSDFYLLLHKLRFSGKIWNTFERSDKVRMNRLVVREVLKLCAKSIAITAIVGVIIGIIGYVKEWNSPISYSNAFFVAGCLLIIAGASSRYASSQDWNEYQLLNAESFREMSSSERVNHIVNENSPLHLVLLGVLSGMTLILISAIAAFLF